MATGTECDYGHCPRPALYRVTISVAATGQPVERRPACAQHVGPMCDAVPSGYRQAATTLDSARANPSTSLHVQHTAEGTLVHGTKQGDRELADQLKAHGFRWSPNLGAWYLNRRWRYATRDARVRDLLIELEFGGYPVELDNEPPADWGNPDDPCVFVEDEHQGMHFCLVHPRCAATSDEPLPEEATFVQPGSAAALSQLPHVDGQPAHVDYPHEPGRLFDCPACEARCHCTPGHIECVFDGPHHDFTDPDHDNNGDDHDNNGDDHGDGTGDDSGQGSGHGSSPDPGGGHRTGPSSGGASATATEITGVSDALALTESWERETGRAMAQLEATTAALERAEVGPELTSNYAVALEAFSTAHEAFTQARTGLRGSVNVGEAYRAAPGAGNKQFLTN